MKKTLLAFLSLAALLSCSKQVDFTEFVDPMIGTGAHGHVFVGASVPFGCIQLGPTSVPQEWDWCSGYHESDSTVIGFSHNHLSGTGIGDLFDVTILPVVGDVTYEREAQADIADRTTELNTPGFYKVTLLNSGVFCRMTATAHVGLEEYVFPENSTDKALVFDLVNGGCWDKLTECDLVKTGEYTIEGYRFSKGWAADQKTYFAAEFSEPIEKCENVADGYWRISFADAAEVAVKVSLSAKSSEGAAANIAAELPGWDFDATCNAARDAWNAELGKIKITTGDETARKIFYTSLYHTMLNPANFADAGEDPRYTILSLWDTYRAWAPLFSIIHSEKENDLINSFLDIYDAQGKLPVWHLWGNETDCMVGNPAIPITADAILKGFDGFDVEKAFEAMKVSAMRPDRGQDLRMKYGYIPADLLDESVAIELEYALADWALAQAALKLGKTEDYEYFLERSKSYKKHFDPETGYMRGVKANGKFTEPFSPFFSNHFHSDYTEGNGWQYTWLVPHDFKGLCECFKEYKHFTPTNIDRHFSGREALIQKLDSLFIVSSVLEGEHASPDISGLIGQYAHGNEPSHHTIYLYDLAGQPWKTADLVRQVCAELYTTEPDGICGNEDCGEMSAWYVLSSMGLYEVEPAGGRYWFGSPLFDKAEIALGGGKTFIINAPNNSVTNKYIQKVELNGRPYTKGYIDYSTIMEGGELTLYMGSEPKLWYCADEPEEYVSNRPAEADRLFVDPAIDEKIAEVQSLLTNPRLSWMFEGCFPNTLDTTVHFTEDDGSGNPDTFIYTGDIHAMWLRDSGAQVWPYVRFAADNEHIRKMIEGTIRRQFKCLCIDPYANAFNMGPTGSEWESDNTEMKPELHERKWEIDSQCYPIRLAYGYWKTTGDTSVFDETWFEAISKILETLHKQQRKDNVKGDYYFTRECDRQYDMKCNYGYGNPVNPVGLVASAFRPSDDATVFDFLVPSNFFAVTSLRKAAEIIETVGTSAVKEGEWAADALAEDCRALADEIETALYKYAVVDHPEFGKIFAYEVDGFGSAYLMDDTNVPSLLALAYLEAVDVNDKIYQNTRNFVLSAANPYRFEGPAGAAIGGPHIGYDYIWPMSVILRALTSNNDEEIQNCIIQLMTTDAGTGFMHESYEVSNPAHFTRSWFAWANTLFGELILTLIDEGKIDLLNEII